MTDLAKLEKCFSEYVFEPLARWALVCPSKPAVISDSVVWTYREFEEKTNSIAHVLRRRGVGKGDRVAFVLPRGPEAVLILVAILKAGAAYVPLDAESPPSRVRECLEDARPTLVIYESAKGNAMVPDETESVSLEWVLTESLLAPTESIATEVSGLRPTDLAYIIFTSGSTGRPKGVPITHLGLSNFVHGDQKACIRVTPDDRVFQGFSPASDGHHEEVWPTFLAGATLVVATGREVHSGPELAAFLNHHKVTIISCAPTLLSMVEDEVPTLKRILFGAENLPAAIVERWWKPDREIINTYGPTEATVGATFGYCRPGQAVTIGHPLPNYFCDVLNDDFQPVPPGSEGQLAISGVGVTSGYFGRPDLNVGRFVKNSQFEPEHNNPICYLTGDLVKEDEFGNLVWLGRIDSQVKIRGHRVELSEIESQILAYPDIRSVAVVVREVRGQDVQLAALAVLKEDVQLSIGAFFEHLRSSLPGYMVPQVVEILEKIPVLPSGKIDRKACQSLRGTPLKIDREVVPPRTASERLVLDIWQSIFPGQEISCLDDFFTDLGGYSLLASRFISILRGDYGLSQVSVIDVYENPSVRSFAAHLDSGSEIEEDRPDFKHVPPGRFRMAKFLQAIGVLTVLFLQGLLWVGPVVLAIYLSNIGFTETGSVVMGLLVRAAMVPVVLASVIVLKWTVVGKFKEGTYPIWSGPFLRYWYMGRLMAIAPVGFLTGTPLAGLYLRLLGAKVGRNVILESMDIDCPDVISIGDHCNLENSTWLHAAEVTQGELHIRKIRIEDGCTLGVRSGVSGGAELNKGATLRDLSSVGAGITIPKGEEWYGSPARKCEKRILPLYDPQDQPSRARWIFFGLIQCLLIGLLTMLESIPFMVIGFSLYTISEGWVEYLWEPVWAILMVLFAMVQALAVKWAVLGRLKEGTYRFPSAYWIRKWFSDKHLELVSSVIVPIYDSLFARAWCVALGMKCGHRCEIALPRRMPYDLVEMGEESFLASEVSIGMPIRRNGKLRLERTVVGKRVFLGNDSVVPQGTHVPEESLLGVLSLWPTLDEAGPNPRQAWLGSPAFRMPNREVNSQFDDVRLYHPTRRLYLERLAHEALRLVLPSLCSLLVASCFFEAFTFVWNESNIRVALLLSPVMYLLTGVIAAVLCRIAKAWLVGKYEPTVSPLWSPFVWKAETYSAVLHDFGVPVFIQAIVGTPFLAWLMRFLGAEVGKRTFINTTDWTETDLIHIGDDVSINTNAPLQAHLFEDRVMKVGPIRIGDRCSVGHYTVVLCESELKSDSHVGHLSLVMKGEKIPSHTFWAGSPVQITPDPRKTFERSRRASELDRGNSA